MLQQVGLIGTIGTLESSVLHPKLSDLAAQSQILELVIFRTKVPMVAMDRHLAEPMHAPAEAGACDGHLATV